MSAAAVTRAPVAGRGASGGEPVGGGAVNGVSAPREPAGRIQAIQRSRLLAAAVRAIDELGYPDTSVADITARARVSRRTFYEHFADREACLAAALEDALDALTRELAAADVDGLQWRERVRTGLWTVLVFLDREPSLAHVCVVEALRGGPRVLERRAQVLAALVAVVDEGCGASPRASLCTPLTAEGLVGAAFGIVYVRLLKRSPEPLLGLMGELMGMIVLPYLGPAAARREQERPVPPPPLRGASEPPTRVDFAGSVGAGSDPLQGVPMRLTYRTSRVLESIAAHAGNGISPSNRQIADYAGIHDPGQVSKLLRRLERLGLLVNDTTGRAKGEPNAWRLTPTGKSVAQGIRAHGGVQEETASLFTNRGALPSGLEEEKHP